MPSMKELRIEDYPDITRLSNSREFESLYFEHEGLEIITEELEDNRAFSYNGERYAIRKGTIMGELHFMPDGPLSYIMWIGLEGLEKFFKELDVLKVNGEDHLIPTFLYGDTNQDMAIFAHRLGFVDIESDGVGHEIAAPVSLVRSNLELIKQERNLAKLKERAAREVEKYDGSRIRASLGRKSRS